MKNLKIKFERRFLLSDLPAPLTRRSEHLQFFDNYLTGTRLLLRKTRDPQTKKWTHYFVQKYSLAPPDLSQIAVAEIQLNEYEHTVLSIFEGNELRYNRYFLQLETGGEMLIDMFLNRELWNLILATVEFETADEMKDFAAPFGGTEITDDVFFSGVKLADVNIEQVRQKISR